MAVSASYMGKLMMVLAIVVVLGAAVCAAEPVPASLRSLKHLGCREEGEARRHALGDIGLDGDLWRTLSAGDMCGLQGDVLLSEWVSCVADRLRRRGLWTSADAMLGL